MELRIFGLEALSGPSRPHPESGPDMGYETKTLNLVRLSTSTYCLYNRFEL